MRVRSRAPCWPTCQRPAAALDFSRCYVFAGAPIQTGLSSWGERRGNGAIHPAIVPRYIFRDCRLAALIHSEKTLNNS
jgi:hypothetical protein